MGTQIATTTDTTALPDLIDRAANTLSSARSSAEVLEARDMARVAYDAAKSAGRMARAKQAHDDVIAAVYRSQADAAVIEARAKVRLADEYDAAQERGEVGQSGQRNDLVADGDEVKPTAADLGLRRDEIHEARKLRDAEAQSPGAIEAAADALVARGEEPTKAAMRREIVGEASPQPAAPDPLAEYRKGLSSLTREGLEDEVAGLRADLAETKAKLKQARDEARKLKDQVADFTGDSATVVRRMQAEITRLQSAVYRANEKFDAEHRLTYRLKKELKAALDELGQQEIPL